MSKVKSFETAPNNNGQYTFIYFSDSQIDFVLQGHDHVLSRGFIQANGYAADITKQISDRKYKAKDPDNTPLYYCGNTGSSLKFYAPIMNDGWIFCPLATLLRVRQTSSHCKKVR